MNNKKYVLLVFTFIIFLPVISIWAFYTYILTSYPNLFNPEQLKECEDEIAQEVYCSKGNEVYYKNTYGYYNDGGSYERDDLIKLDGLDKVSLRILDYKTVRDDDTLYVRYRYGNSRFKLMEDVHPDDFAWIVDGEGNDSVFQIKEDLYKWYRSNYFPLEGIDFHTFEYLDKKHDNNYFKDKNGVYYIDNDSKKYSVLDIDQEEVKVNDNDFIVDYDKFYPGIGFKNGIPSPLESIDAVYSYQIDHLPLIKFGHIIIDGFYTDLEYVYNQKGMVLEADPGTFTFIDCNYYKDKNYIYVKNKETEKLKIDYNLDPQTFDIDPADGDWDCAQHISG